MTTAGKRNSGGLRRRAESTGSDTHLDDYERHYRFSIGLRIKHLALSRAEIAQALGITPMYGWDAGEPRITAVGKPLPGLSPFTAFGFSEDVRHKRSFFESALGMLERLEAAADFVRGITDTGGKVSIDVALYGRRNIGDVIGWSALMRFAALKVELGVEVFPVKQRGW